MITQWRLGFGHLGPLMGLGVALGPHQPGVTYKAVMWGSAVSRLMLHTHDHSQLFIYYNI